MESPGEYLKREREMRGVALEDISHTTKIRVGLLSAIEKNDFDALPAAPFVKGFIQAYCKYLGLDEHDALLRYEAYIRSITENEASAIKQKSETRSKQAITSVAETFTLKSPLLAIAIALIALLIIAGGIYGISKSKKHLSSPSDSSVLPQAESSSTAKTLNTQAEPALESESATKRESPSLPVKSEAQTNLNREASVPKIPAKKENKETKDIPSGNIADKGPLILIIEATKPTWIKAEIDEQNPFEVSLKQGEKIKWNAKEKFSVLIGNAGGVNVIFNGNPLGRLGDEGKLVKLVLPKERLQSPDLGPQTQN